MWTGVRAASGSLLVLVWVVCLPVACTATSQPHSALTYKEATLREVLAGRQVYSYRSYKDVQIFHFSVPPHVSLSVYNFTANDSLACEPRNITIFLQAHSYPVINPDGAMYPPGLWVNRSRMYEVHLRSDLKPALLSVQYPVAGDWFMVAFIDEASNRITQAGLFPSCHSWLQAKATHQQQGDVTTVVPEIHSYQDIQLFQKINDSQYYRFYVPSSTWVVVVSISKCMDVGDKNASCPIDIAFRARALPDPDSIDTVFHTCSDGNAGDMCIAEFIPEEEAWHYLQITPPPSTPVQLIMAVKLHLCDEVGGSSYHLLSKVNLDQLCPEESSVHLDTTFTIFNNTPGELSNATISQEDLVQSGHIIFMPATKTKEFAVENCWPSEVVECSGQETSILFHISSASCLDGKCGTYGSCYQYISGGFIFSTCVCDAGYRGWGCTDSSQATPNWELLLSTLLLTLSNLFFLPAIILALKRRYFAEALVYVFTMVFSTFYHACDQEAYVFCLMRLSVMQFCDFYSAIFSFWVTLIAMADLPHSLYSLLHVAGAMIVALGVEYDRTGLWVFVVPSLSAFLVMTSSWIWHCKQQEGCFPSKQYWLTSLLPGVLLAASGLICYAFFETHDNYFYVHSVWHATMALAILCLLPPRREKEEVCDDDEDVEPLSECEAQPIMAEAHNSEIIHHCIFLPF